MIVWYRSLKGDREWLIKCVNHLTSFRTMISNLWIVFHSFFFFLNVIYFNGRLMEERGKRERERTFLQLLHIPKPTTARTRPAIFRSVELHVSLLDMQEKHKHLRHHLQLPREHISRRLVPKWSKTSNPGRLPKCQFNVLQDPTSVLLILKCHLSNSILTSL